MQRRPSNMKISKPVNRKKHIKNQWTESIIRKKKGHESESRNLRPCIARINPSKYAERFCRQTSTGYFSSSGFPQRSNRGPICYSCPQQRAPELCDKISVCGKDSVNIIYLSGKPLPSTYWEIIVWVLIVYLIHKIAVWMLYMFHYLVIILVRT